MNCPKCGVEMDRFEDEADVGIADGFSCPECGRREPLEV